MCLLSFIYPEKLGAGMDMMTDNSLALVIGETPKHRISYHNCSIAQSLGVRLESSTTGCPSKLLILYYFNLVLEHYFIIYSTILISLWLNPLAYG